MSLFLLHVARVFGSTTVDLGLCLWKNTDDPLKNRMGMKENLCFLGRMFTCF